MIPEIALLVVIVLLLGIVGVQSYFLYRMSQMVAVLNAAPNAEAARILLRTATGRKPEPPKPKDSTEIEVSPADLDADALAKLRKQQDERN